MDKTSKILVVGHGDIIETSLLAALAQRGFGQAVSAHAIGLDVLSQERVHAFIRDERIDHVVLGSVRSGGIEANQQHGAEFIHDNLAAQTNVIEAAYQYRVRKLFFLSSSCVYPKSCPQPMRPEYLFTGALEKTSEPYATAKISGMVMCQAYRRQYGFNAVVAIPATVYGPGMDMAGSSGHVVGALIKKFADAAKAGDPEVSIWGTGEPRREFIFSEDFAQACLFIMEKYDGPETLHIGCGEDIAIKDLAQLTAEETDFQGKIVYDLDKPDGAPLKLLDSSRLRDLGWKPHVGLREGIRRTVQWYQGRPER